MKFRLIIDNHAALGFPWYRIEREDAIGWGYIDSGDEKTMRAKFEAIKANPERYTTIDEFDSSALVKPLEGAHNSGLVTTTYTRGDIDECTSKRSEESGTKRAAE